MKLDLTGKTALVAGSSGGIGRAVASAFAEEGCRVVLCARSRDTLEAVAADLRSRFNADVSVHTADLDSKDDITRMCGDVRRSHGAVDILVTNNGGPPTGLFADLDDPAWEAAWHRTLMSAVRLIRAWLPDMQQRGFGRIIAITSISVKQPIPRLMLSNAYRAAVTGMAKTLSDEVARDGITVNCIAPGYIETDRMRVLMADRAHGSGRTFDAERDAIVRTVPAGRMGRPDEIADLARFLASERAAYITGSTILVDGGMYRGAQ